VVGAMKNFSDSQVPGQGLQTSRARSARQIMIALAASLWHGLPARRLFLESEIEFNG